jgi:glycosyltransferase involved in cell wall biosynthesis
MTPTSAKAVIYYHPDGYTTAGPKLMGRNAAGESFLRGFLQYSQANVFWAQVRHAQHGEHFSQAVHAVDPDYIVKTVESSQLASLAEVGTVFYPGPGIGKHAHQRALFGHGAWSLCGITHTTSSAGAMDAIVELLTAPVQPWDAVICTSTAVKNNVERMLQAQVDFLVDRLGMSKLVLPMLPVIPLGIHTADFSYSAEQKSAARAALGVDANTLVVLYAGRLSFHAKAHPLAMYQALEKAARGLPANQKVVLVECGWFANEQIGQAFAAAAALACPSVRIVTLDGRVAAARQTAWAGADVFCSLSDNVQETFGIVPIEAMAAGLPVVVSDWDGYKDTVRDGVDGFRIPTLQPAFGLGNDLALRHALEIDTYDMYCGLSCAVVAVDVEVAAQAFARLFAAPELRQKMGQAGRERAAAVFDWRAVMLQYEELWAIQTEVRLTQGATLTPLAHPWPARMDPFHSFAGYPTHTLMPDTMLALVDADADSALARLAVYGNLAMIRYAGFHLPTMAEMRALITATARGRQPALALVGDIPDARKPQVFRSLAWLLKLGILTTQEKSAL